MLRSAKALNRLKESRRGLLCHLREEKAAVAASRAPRASRLGAAAGSMTKRGASDLVAEAAKARRGNDSGKRKVRRSASAEVEDATTATGRYSAKEKVAKLRALLEKHAISAYVVPTDDPHLCEMPPAAFRRRDYISGFTGSAGTALITTKNAANPTEDEDDDEAGRHAEGFALLWTDGRYFLQAETELMHTPWSLMKSGMPDVPEPIKWLKDRLKPGSRVGIDPMVFTVSTAREFRDDLVSVQCSLIPVDNNLVDEVWKEDNRPDFPSGKVRVHPLKYAGATVEDKIAEVRSALEEEGASGFLVTTLDEVCWLLNIRGADIENSPVVVAYVLVTTTACTLFVDEIKLGTEVLDHLRAAGVGVRDYGAVKDDVASLCQEEGAKVWVDVNQCTSGLYDLMCRAIEKKEEDEAPERVQILRDDQVNEFRYDPASEEIVSTSPGQPGGESIILNEDSGALIEKKSPISMQKAKKNEAEIDGLVEAHLRDGCALAHFFEWLEITIGEEGKTPTEYEISEKLLEFRSLQTGFIEPSFPTIAGEGENGAVIHYRPERETCNTLFPTSMLLLDSGGQFDCGTTDVTRTVHFGEPTGHQKACYTRVLKGHIALGTLIFPEDIPGFMIDSFARSALWRGGLDYRHGTGHGVGAGLNVHEGPCGISARYSNTTGICKGMVLSNEPGYYEEGEFGIRIENLVWVSKAATAAEFGGKDYLQFNDLTMVPIQKKLMAMDLLTEEERAWVDAYHAKVWEAIGPRLEGTTKEWLRKECEPLVAMATL